jgi:hypothetical protein
LPGKQDALHFQFQLSDEMGAQMVLEASEYNLRGNLVGLDDLPADLKRALQDAVDSVKRQFSRDNLPTGTGVSTPP